MIRIDMIRQDTRYPNPKRRHQGRATCAVGGKRFEADGPAPIYKLATLLSLHGHGGVDFEVWDDRSFTGETGGLAMRGKVRNWASFETPRGKRGTPIFRAASKPNPDFTSEQRIIVAKAAGAVVAYGADSRVPFAPGRASRPAESPDHPGRQEDASTRVSSTQTPEAA